jgi:serine/threonine-protein kinase
VRLSLAGHQDLVEEVDLDAGERLDFRRRLTPAQATDRRPILYGTVALLLLGFTAWAWRRLTAEHPPALAPTPRVLDATPSPVRGTPPGMSSPGVRRDASGHEFFGEYRLLEPLGRGGMASVFKAERDGEVCALKRPLYAYLDEPEFLERFLREADIGRTLHHPNVIRILERGEVEGVPYLAMELLPGETLQARIERQGALPPREAAAVVVQIAEALDYAHSKGVVHRDLKPSNVMLLADGTTKVMDFGIARARRFEGLTVTGAFLGSPDYIAPEAIEGGKTDARSDLYSLGVTFYEALTGRRPFSGDTPFAVLRMHLTETPAPPSSLLPDVPPELERMVLRLLSKDPADRISSAEDLVRELRDFLNRAA